MARTLGDPKPASLESQREWLAVRSHMRNNRHELTRSVAARYRDVPTVAHTQLLARTEWLPTQPIEVESIGIEWDPAGAASEDAVLRRQVGCLSVVPEQRDGTAFASYSAAMAELAAPTVFENRRTYRLRQADLSGASGKIYMRFGQGRYFDAIDLGEACAHEYAAATLHQGNGTPLRDAYGTPCQPERQPTNLAVATLVLRHDVATGTAQFPLHWRDPGKVGQSGGMYMVAPVGIFQPSNDAPGHLDNDFSLWRCIVREFAEELLGVSEEHDADAPIDYDVWEPAVRMAEEQRRGRVRIYALALGTDPLTLTTDLLTVMVIEDAAWDGLVRGMVEHNAEGRLVRPTEIGAGPADLFSFTETSIERLIGEFPMEVAGAALLRLAWSHRKFLIG